jgi:hypothetical protein
MFEMPRQNPLGLSTYTLKRNEGLEGKTNFLLEWVPERRGGV